jgi:hypothetical protein
MFPPRKIALFVRTEYLVSSFYLGRQDDAVTTETADTAAFVALCREFNVQAAFIERFFQMIKNGYRSTLLAVLS